MQLFFQDPGHYITSWNGFLRTAIEYCFVSIDEHSQRQKPGTVLRPEGHFSSTAPSRQWGEFSILDTRQRTAAGPKVYFPHSLVWAAIVSQVGVQLPRYVSRWQDIEQIPRGCVILQASKSVRQEAAIPSKKRHNEQLSKSGRTYLKSCKVDDELFCVGDSAYALEEGQTYKVCKHLHDISDCAPLV